MRMSKKQTRINTKKKTFFLVKGIEKGQTCKKTYKIVKMSNKKGKKKFETCRSVRKSF